MEKWLDIGAAVLAIAAAIFWFVSAAGKLPPIMIYWGQAPASDPYYIAVMFSAEMNRWAALLSGLSATCMGGKRFLPARLR